MRYYRVLNRLFLDFDSQISPKRLCSRDMALFTCHDDPDRFFSTETHPAILDTTGNDAVYEALATANDYL